MCFGGRVVLDCCGVYWIQRQFKYADTFVVYWWSTSSLRVSFPQIQDTALNFLSGHLWTAKWWTEAGAYSIHETVNYHKFDSNPLRYTWRLVPASSQFPCVLIRMCPLGPAGVWTDDGACTSGNHVATAHAAEVTRVVNYLSNQKLVNLTSHFSQLCRNRKQAVHPKLQAQKVPLTIARPLGSSLSLNEYNLLV